jgi:hypothetical protein
MRLWFHKSCFLRISKAALGTYLFNMIIGWVACHLSVYLRCLWLLVGGGSDLLSVCLSETSIVTDWRIVVCYPYI